MDANLNEHIVLLICQHTSYVLPHTCLYVSALTWWRHQMETFSALLALGVGNSRSPVNSPHKGQRRGALMFSWICTWINGWYNREAGDLRHHHAHYDATVMNTLRPHRTNAEFFLLTGHIRTNLGDTKSFEESAFDNADHSVQVSMCPSQTRIFW